MHIDLNADLGEGAGSDEALLGLVSSANIACGWHAGDAQNSCASACAGPSNTAWPSARTPAFPTAENFGRNTMHLPPDEIVSNVLYQVGALAAIVKAEGGQLSHVEGARPALQPGGEGARARRCAVRGGAPLRPPRSSSSASRAAT